MKRGSDEPEEHWDPKIPKISDIIINTVYTEQDLECMCYQVALALTLPSKIAAAKESLEFLVKILKRQYLEGGLPIPSPVSVGLKCLVDIARDRGLESEVCNLIPEQIRQ